MKDASGAHRREAASVLLGVPPWSAVRLDMAGFIKGARNKSVPESIHTLVTYSPLRDFNMNRIVWLVGAVVIVIAVLSVLGLR
jgi:hypothetical protein